MFFDLIWRCLDGEIDVFCVEKYKFGIFMGF